MADTKRTKAALALIFADNGIGDISGQDLRDYLESLDVSRGAYYWTAFATTTIPSIGTAVAGGTNRVKLLGTTVSKTLNRFSHASPNQLTYTGAPAIKADFFAQFCFKQNKVATTNYAFEWYLNAAYLTGSFTHLSCPGGTAIIHQITVFGEATLANLDTLELYVANTSNAGAIITPVAGYCNIQEIPLA